MSYRLKYQCSFKTLDNDDCRIDIYVWGAEAGVKRLNPGANPFVLKEYNNDKDFFKPLRSFIAEMQFLSNNVSMDEFLTNNDEGVQVQFYFRNSLFWAGWLIQDDFEENWIDTAHYITLRATDGLGSINAEHFPYLVGQTPIIDYLGYCLEATILRFLNRRVVCNLFYEGQGGRGTNPLDDITLDPRTFQGDDKQKILEKILKAWSMSVYQWRGRWFVARVAEWLTNKTIYGISEESLSLDETFNSTYEVNIGVGETIKPVMPEMLRSIRRPFKKTRIEYYYKFPTEIFCNQNFQKGSPIIPTTDTYTIDCWTLYKGATPLTLSAGTAPFYRKEEKDIDGRVLDSYMFIGSDSVNHFAKSNGILMNYQDAVKISFDYRGVRNVGTGPFNTIAAYVELVPDDGSDSLWMMRDGLWGNNSTNVYLFTVAAPAIGVSYSEVENINDWKNIAAQSKPVPKPGILYVYLGNVYLTDTDANFKGLEFEIIEASKVALTTGDYDEYTETENIKQSYIEECFLDDANNRWHKGALHYDNALTGDKWYREDFDSERLTFKRQKALAHSFLNKRFRYKLDVNMRGITWMDGSAKRPIWLQNKFTFVDDAPTKKFMIVDLSELNFSQATWKGTLLEIWDDDLDDADVASTHSYGFIFENEM